MVGSDENKSEKERLLRKAKEYVEREERRKEESNQRRRKRNDDEDDRKPKRRKSDKKRRRRREEEAENGHSSDGDDSRRRSSKKHSQHSHKQKKHSQKQSKSRKDERRKESKKKEHKSESLVKVDKSKLYPLGQLLGRAPDRLLDVDQDYFAFHQHLWVYLHREEGTAFGDLNSEEARAAFERFCRKYNSGKLEMGYYDKVLPQGAVDESKTTRHKWAFQTNATEEQSLHLIEEGVRKQTEYNAQQGASLDEPPVANSTRPVPITFDDDKYGQRITKSPKERLAERVANRRLREHVRIAEEEFSGGRGEGRECLLEKKKEISGAIHGAARDREESLAGAELRDSNVYGSGDSEFQAALARERQRKEKKTQKHEARIAELQQQEQNRQEAMLKALGLAGIKAGQKITIQPRKDLPGSG